MVVVVVGVVVVVVLVLVVDVVVVVNSSFGSKSDSILSIPSRLCGGRPTSICDVGIVLPPKLRSDI